MIFLDVVTYLKSIIYNSNIFGSTVVVEGKQNIFNVFIQFSRLIYGNYTTQMFSFLVL